MKKILHILIICSLLFSLVQVPNAYATQGQGEEYALLKDLKIVRDNADFNEQLSAEDLARMVVMLQSYGKTDEKADFLQTAKNYGLLSDSIKAPLSLDTVTLALVKSVYGRLCENKTDREIIDFGSINGIYKSVRIVDSNDLTLGEAAGLARNILDMDSVVYDGDSYKLDSKTVLEENFEIEYKDGVLYTGKMRGFSDGHVSIDNEVYDTDKDYTEYGGYMVRAYVRDDEIISIDTQKFQNDVYIISANDIDGVTSDSITFYTTRDSKQKLLIDLQSKEIYNGRLVDFNYNDMDISNGYITLIRHPGKNRYNVIVINQYDIMVAGGAGNNMIYGLEGAGITVKLDPDTIKTTITLDGEEVPVTEIKKYDVLTLSYTRQKDELDIEIVRNTVTGTLDMWGKDTIKLGRKTYIKTAYFKQHAKQSELGSEVELLLDKSGLAVDIKHVGSKNRYGYFMGMYYDSAYERYNIRVLTDNGERELLTLKDKVIINGRSTKVGSDDDNAIQKAFKTLIEIDINGNRTQRTVNYYVYQMIIFRTDSNDEIQYIDTAIEEEYEDDDEELKLEKYIDKNIKYKSGAAQFIDSFGITGDGTVIFRVPATDNVFDASGNLDEAKRALANRNKHYEVVAPGFIKNDAKVMISAYNISRGGLAEATVLYNEDLTTEAEFKDTSMPLFVVTEVMKGRDPEGDPCYVLEGLEKNAKKRYYIKEEEFGRKENGSDGKVYPQENDIMQIKADSDGIVLSYTTRYSRNDNISYYERSYDEAEFGCMSGYVTDKDENGFKFMSTFLTGTTKERTAMNKGVNAYYIYDVGAKTMRSGSIQDMIAKADSRYNPSQIFCTSSFGEVRQVIIYVDKEE